MITCKMEKSHDETLWWVGSVAVERLLLLMGTVPIMGFLHSRSNDLKII